MSRQRQTPIIVGVGDAINRSRQVEHAVEPLHLILDAIRHALEDTGLSPTAASELRARIDSIDCVRTWTWPYPDLPSLVAQHLAVEPRHTHYPKYHGGNQPCKLLDDAARRVARGESDVAVVAGGEALASLAACAAAKKLPPPGWTRVDEEVAGVFSPTTRKLAPSIGARHGAGNPIHVYPLYENGFRAHRHQSIPENHAESAELYAEFAQVAAQHPFSWNYGVTPHTSETIATVNEKNRMICLPYPLLMNAFNTVNLSAAVIVTSTARAKEIGISEDRWIYPLGGAGTQDIWERPSFSWSPAISRSLDAGLAVSGVRKEDIDLFDFYSCYPIVPKLACHHLGLPFTRGSRPITLLGGLTSFGGAGNNYSMHAISEMVRQIRKGQGKTGLILANGGIVTYQFVVCLSKTPRPAGSPYPEANPLPDMITDVQVPTIAEHANGGAVIETYTVEFDRAGVPTRGVVVGRLKSSGHRFVANHADEATLRELCSRDVEPVGRVGNVKRDADGRNLFAFSVGSTRL